MLIFIDRTSPSWSLTSTALSRPISSPISNVAEEAKKNDQSDEARIGLIGSCTNSSYEDMTRPASIVKQAQGTRTRLQEQPLPPDLNVVPLSLMLDGQIEDFECAGSIVLANTCGPCIGQWDDRQGVEKGDKVTRASSSL